MGITPEWLRPVLISRLLVEFLKLDFLESWQKRCDIHSSDNQPIELSSTGLAEGAAIYMNMGWAIGFLIDPCHCVASFWEFTFATGAASSVQVPGRFLMSV